MSNTSDSAIGRTPPHSIEAEEYLLSCCFLDGADIVARCTEAKLAPAAFYVPANRVIFEALVEMHQAGKSIDLMVLAEELKTRRQLEEIGGYAYLTQISTRVPTTAQSAFFIERVQTLAALREIIRGATEGVERAYAYSGDIGEVLAPMKRAIERGGTVGASAVPEALRQLVEDRRFDFARQLKKPEPRFLIQGKGVATPGNICNIIAQAKSGKSALIGAWLAAAMVAESGEQADTLGVSSVPPRGRILLHIDTEQSLYDADSHIRRALARASADAAPEWLWSYHLAGFGPSQIRVALSMLLPQAEAAGGVFAVIVDGVADLVDDVNDPDTCNPFVAEIQGMAIKYDCPVVTVIHENPTQDTGKARGHLGSQLIRKAESNLRLKKTEGVTVVFAEQLQRGAPILEKDGPAFQWSDALQMHVSTASVANGREQGKTAELRELAVEVFDGVSALPYTAITKAIETARGCSRATAERRVGEMKKGQIIRFAGDGKYALAA